jgi:cysteine sulfinate desulfinase/cysteine desulfurase-like protein
VEAKSSFRISLGRPTTANEIEMAAGWLSDAINDYRLQSPVWQMFKQGINIPDATS